MKIEAYIYENEEWKEISVYDIAKIDDTNYRRQQYISKTTFYLEPYFDSIKLIFSGGKIKKWHFKYPKSFPKNQLYITKSESYTHKCCKEVIINDLNNKIRLNVRKNWTEESKKITFVWDYAYKEIHLNLGDKIVVPDLLLRIKSPSIFAYKWNQLLAVEIHVSNDTKKKGDKLSLLEQYKISTIQINANSKWGRKKEENMNNEEKEKLRQWIKNSFLKGEYGADLLIDTESQKYLESEAIKKLKKLKEENNSLKSKNEKLKNYEGKYIDLSEEINHLKPYKEKYEIITEEKEYLKNSLHGFEKLKHKYKTLNDKLSSVTESLKKEQETSRSYFKIILYWILFICIAVPLGIYLVKKFKLFL